MNLLKNLKELLKIFTEQNIWMAVAESCTGGYVCHMITNLPGASKVFERGIVCYSNEAKVEILRVNPKNIEEQGAVSEIVAFELAKNVRETTGVNLGIGITGIAGPMGGTLKKPVGLVFIGFSTEKKTLVERHVIKADRITFKKKVLEKIISKLNVFVANDFEL